MRFEVESNEKYLRLVDGTETDVKNLETYFTRKVKDFWIKKKVAEKKGRSFRGFDGEIKFFTKAQRIPIGLWYELYNFSKQVKSDLKIDGLKETFNLDVTKDYIDSYVQSKFTDRLGFDKRDYQIDTIYKLAKYRFGQAQIGTSGGKTFIIYVLYSYLKEMGKLNGKMLVIVPTVGLVAQGYGDFCTYHDWTKGNLNVAQKYSGIDTFTNDSEILISTYQTLNNQDKDFFKDFDMVVCDESHKAKTTTIKNILQKRCTNVNYKYGVSGTIKTLDIEGTADFFTLQSSIGPIVVDVPAKELIDKGYSSPVNIQIYELNYLSKDERKELAYLAGSKKIESTDLYSKEQLKIIQNNKRLTWLVNFVKEFENNSMVLFNDVKWEYGKRIYQRLKSETKGKEIYYIDGHTDKEQRREFVEKMEEGTNKILIASFGCVSTGINIHNLHNIILAQNYKSQITIMQTLGRGLRTHENKNEINFYDIADNFKTSYTFADGYKYNYVNYSLKHMNERKKVYDKKQHPYEIHKVKI
jgi:superfamily II DNA or RNA helicase